MVDTTLEGERPNAEAPVPDETRPASPKRQRGQAIVPKIIHQFWDSADPPPDVAARMRSWPAMHPRWAYIQWNDESAESLIATHHGADAARLFRACVPATMRADLLRVAALSLFGGVYADADSLCLQPFDDLRNSVCTLSFRDFRDRPNKAWLLDMDHMIATPEARILRLPGRSSSEHKAGGTKGLEQAAQASRQQPLQRHRSGHVDGCMANPERRREGENPPDIPRGDAGLWPTNA